MATLSGPVVTTIAIIAIASVGFATLNGRMDLRRGATVLLGCFVLFGAQGIAVGLMGFSQFRVSQIAQQAPPPPNYPSPNNGAGTANGYDPYTRASVPN
jgi:TrbC/VIRB2 pilin